MTHNKEYYSRLQNIIDILNYKPSDDKEEENANLTEEEISDLKEKEKEEELDKALTTEKRNEKKLKFIKRNNDYVKKLDEIKKEFEELIGKFLEDYPDSHEAYFLIGRQAFVSNMHSIAWEAFNKAWELDQTILEYSDAMAVMSSHIGQIKEGVFYAKLSLILQPHPHLKGLTIKILTDYRKSLLQSRSITSNFNTIFSPLNHGHYAKVIQFLEAELKINDRHGLSYYYMGFSYYKLGDLHQALDNVRTAYLVDENNKDYLPLLAEICLRLHMYAEAYGYLSELEQISKYSIVSKVLKQKYLILNNSYDDSSALTNTLWNNIRNIEKLHTERDALPDYKVTPYTDVYARIGVIINSSTPSEILDTLIYAPDKFRVIYYDVDDAKDKDIVHLLSYVTAYRNIHDIDDITSAMIMRNEALDLIIDTTSYATTGSYTKYAYKGVAPLVLSWLSHLEKPFIDGILYSDNHNKLDNYFKISKKTPYKIRNAISMEIPYFLSPEEQPPAFTNGFINLGVVASKENLTPLFLSQLATILRKIPFLNIHFGFDKLLTNSYMNEITTYFAGLKLNSRISFLNYPTTKEERRKYNSQVESINSIDLFLNGAKTPTELMGCLLFSGIPVFALLDGTGESVIATSVLSSANADENRIFESLDDCITEILTLIEDPENLAEIRSSLIKTIPYSLLFNKNVNKNTFWEDIYAITQSVTTPFDKIS